MKKIYLLTAILVLSATVAFSQPASWQNVETMEGTGTPVSRTYPAGGETTFFRVLTSRD